MTLDVYFIVFTHGLTTQYNGKINITINNNLSLLFNFPLFYIIQYTELIIYNVLICTNEPMQGNTDSITL